MRSWSLTFCCALAVTPLLGPPALAAPRTFAGTVSYAGVYTADTLFAAVVDTSNVLLGYQAVPVPTTPFALPFSIGFDDSAATGDVLMAAVLDVDGSGFDPDSLDSVLTDADILGYYDAQPLPTLLDPTVSRSDLDFPLPTGEIHGNVVLAPGQTWAEVTARTLTEDWSSDEVQVSADGPYALVGLYAGDWIVEAYGPPGSICFGDPTCVSPTTISLAVGEWRMGVDLDFSSLAIERDSWGRVKTLYR